MDARVSRSKSIPNALHVTGDISGIGDTTHQVASLLRTTGPPQHRHGQHEDGRGPSRPRGMKRWSLQALRRRSTEPGKQGNPGCAVDQSAVLSSTPTPRESCDSTSSPRSTRISAGHRLGPERTSSRNPKANTATPISLTGSSSDVAATPMDRYTELRLGEAREEVRDQPALTLRSRASESDSLPTPVTAGEVDDALIISQDSYHDYGSIPVPAATGLGIEESGMSPSSRATYMETLNGNQEHYQTPKVTVIPPRTSSVVPSKSHRSLGRSSVLSNTSIETSSTISPRRHKRKPGNIQIKSMLTVPIEALAPESPGFPGMLASMNFPSPPGSRTHTPANSIGIVNQTPITAAVTQSRTLSQNDCSSVPAAPPEKHLVQSLPKYSDQGSSSRSTGVTVLPATVNDRQNVGASSGSCRGLDGNNLHIRAVDPYPGVEQTERRSTVVSSADSACSGLQSPQSSHFKPFELGYQSMMGPDEDHTPRDLDSTTTASLSNESVKPMSIVEKRAERKARIHEIKSQGLNNAQFGLTTPDSPVLGWFSKPEPRHQSPISSGPTHARTTHGCGHTAQPSTATQTSDDTFHTGVMSQRSSVQTLTVQTVEDSSGQGHKHLAKGSSWTLSPIMVACELEPQGSSPGVMPSSQHCQLTMSPIMVVADIECDVARASTLPDLRPQSDVLAPLHPPPRSALRSNGPKTLPQGRHRPPPITMTRNPETGAIERRLSCQGSNRHSLINPMPTPPLSPEIPLKRLSMPYRPTHQVPIARTSPKNMTVKARFMKEKLAKEKEIAEMVARLVDETPGVEKPEDGQDDHLQGEITAENIEDRLRVLEQNGDEWLSILRPLVDRIGQTLEEMRDGSARGRLTMNDFVIDMEAEARRFSFYSQHIREQRETRRNRDHDGFGGGRRKRRPSHRQRQSRELTRRLNGQEGCEEDANQSPKLDLPIEAADSSPGVLSAQEHEFEAQATVDRLMQRQQTMMRELMDQRNFSPPSSSKSQARASSPTPGSRLPPRARGLHEKKRTGNRTYPGEIKHANESLRVSDRREHAYDSTRTNRSAGGLSGMETLMQELRRTSRLSVETKGGRSRKISL